MRNSKGKKGDDALLAALRSCGPVAKGSLSSVRMGCAKKGCTACMAGTGHPAWMFACRVDGRRKCLCVRKRDVPAARAALERGRRVESLLLEEGVRLIESLRAEARVAHPGSRLKVEVRNAREMPFEENTPPPRVNFRKDSGERREAAATALRSKGLPPEAFAREARSTRSKIAELAGRSAGDPEPQKVQNIFREHPDRACHRARGPDIPAENNRAERGARGLVIARKTSFGGQSEEALRVREVNRSVMETLAPRCDDPAAKLAQALDIYASTGKKSAVRDFLFPKAGRLDCAQHQAQR